jgi:cation transport protein ChaC
MIRDTMPKLMPDIIIRTDEQMEQSQKDFLALQQPRQKDLWVFAYGSLMWNPAINFRERRRGVLKGYSRRLDLWMRGGRGSPDCPGLMLGLEKGGTAEGVAMLLPADAADAEYELSLVWQREMFTSVYLPQWVDVETDKGTVRAVTVISNTEHDMYAGQLPEDRIASIVKSATGVLGSNADYLTQTIASMKSLGLRDSVLERIQELVLKL